MPSFLSSNDTLLDYGPTPYKKIDGIATAGETPVTVAHYLGLAPK